MTHEELMAKATEWLQKFDQIKKLPDSVQDVTLDRLPKRSFRDAVIIDFSSEEDHGRIQVILDRNTGDLISATHTPPKARQKNANLH